MYLGITSSPVEMMLTCIDYKTILNRLQDNFKALQLCLHANVLNPALAPTTLDAQI